MLSAGLNFIVEVSGIPSAYLKDFFLAAFGLIICIVEKKHQGTLNAALKRVRYLVRFLNTPSGRAMFYLFMASSFGGEAGRYFQLVALEEENDKRVRGYGDRSSGPSSNDFIYHRNVDSWKRTLIEDFQLAFAWYYRCVSWYLIFVAVFNVLLHLLPVQPLDVLNNASLYWDQLQSEQLTLPQMEEHWLFFRHILGFLGGFTMLFGCAINFVDDYDVTHDPMKCLEDLFATGLALIVCIANGPKAYLNALQEGIFQYFPFLLEWPYRAIFYLYLSARAFTESVWFGELHPWSKPHPFLGEWYDSLSCFYWFLGAYFGVIFLWNLLPRLQLWASTGSLLSAEESSPVEPRPAAAPA